MSDEYYSVWYITDSRWTNSIYKGVAQDPLAPFTLSKVEAEYYLKDILKDLLLCGANCLNQFEIRNIDWDKKNYSLWRKATSWTKYLHPKLGQQQVTSPFKLTKIECEEWLEYIIRNNNVLRDEFEIRQVDATIDTCLNVVTTEAINDHVCPSCNNDRCSKTEKSCWKCGNLL